MTADVFAALAELPGVADAVVRARQQVDLLRDHRVMRRRGGEVAAESLLRGARASAALAGADWPLEELRRRTDLRGEGAEQVRGALRISGELSGLVSVWHGAPAQALSRLHTLAAAGAVASERIGRPRAADEPVDSEAAASHLTTPGHNEVAERLRTLSVSLLADSGAPALVIAAVAHGELLSVRPFGWGDGLVARAAARLVMIDRGLDPRSLAVPEAGLVTLGIDTYRQALAGYSSGTREGVARWLIHCAESIALGAQESLAVCESLLRG